jgi:glycolate oxidase FAD binding subunit
MTDEQSLTKSISAIIGDANITLHPSLEIDGVKPALIARPSDEDQVVECVKVCSDAGASVIPAGGMTWLDCGNPMLRADVVLSLERMNRVADYSPADLTATVEAGLSLNEFNALTIANRQWLPLDPPGMDRSTLGAITACNSSGALRFGFGTPRDYVIGLSLVHANGEMSKSGGKVVKNVAGYDMNKLYVGSYGTLAIITRLTFKLRPLAESSSTILISSSSIDALFEVARCALSADLEPASVIFTHKLPVSSSGSIDSLLVRFINRISAVDYQTNTLLKSIPSSCTASRLSDEQASSVWRQVADLSNDGILLRLSLPLSAARSEFEKAIGGNVVAASADIGTGIIRIALDPVEASVAADIQRLRSSATASNGSLIIEKAPAEIKRQLDPWGDVGSTAALMTAIKMNFDPKSLFNPGKFVLGL